MKAPWLVALIIIAGSEALPAQPAPAPGGAVAIDLPDVVAEVKAAYDRYNDAVNAGNIAVLNSTFWNDPRTTRYGGAENLYGYKAIEGFRTAARQRRDCRYHYQRRPRGHWGGYGDSADRLVLHQRHCGF